ncbi:hypothetical protein KI387_010806, partial [Taxus chinensis]
FLQRRKYERLNKLNGGRKPLRVVKLGGRQHKMAWKLKFVPKLKFRFIKSAVTVCAKSWLKRIRDGYGRMMVDLAHSEFNDRIIADIYKSIGINIQ